MIPYPSPRKAFPRFEEYLSLALMAASKLRMNLWETTIKKYSGKSRWLPNELNIEYTIISFCKW